MIAAFLVLPGMWAPRAMARAPRISDSLVQIGIVHEAAGLVLRAHGVFSLIDQRTGEARLIPDGEEFPVEAQPGALHFGPYRFLGPVRLLPRSRDSYMLVAGSRYEGSLLVKANANRTVTVVQETGIEDYLYGVLAKEMSPEWPEEALKAQAVVARTFALANLGKFEAAGFDFTADERSQAYAGMEGRDKRATAAVEATEGQVLYYKGKVLKAFFHSCCGGRTSNVGAIWGSSEKADKPVRGVKDPWCAASPHMNWTAYVATDDILAALNEHDRYASKIKGIARGKADPSGHLKTLRFYTKQGTLEIRANDFRNWIGSTEFKSTNITRIVPRRKGYEFSGHGYGHGVGLCQYGAKEMAARGKGYRQILDHYFPGAEIRKRDD